MKKLYRTTMKLLMEVYMLKVGIIGAGIMGKGIAQAFLEKGIKVVLYDINSEILLNAKKDIMYQNKIDQMFKEKKLIINIEDLLLCTNEFDEFSEVDFLIEAITEDMESKKNIYQIFDEICKQECRFMSNTSCISITKLASFTKRADKVVGTHFMNPVTRIDTIEAVRGMLTSDETISKVNDLLLKIEKTMVLIEDFPGFVSNRISHLMMNEAAFLVQDKVATPQQIDTIFKKCYGHKMGPLETADLIGLDTVVDSLNVLYNSYKDSKFRCCPLLQKMVDAGLYGRKTHKGFYEYEEDF